MTLQELIDKEAELKSVKDNVIDVLARFDISAGTENIKIYVGNYNTFCNNTTDKTAVRVILVDKLARVTAEHKKASDKLTLLEQLINP